MQLQFNIHNAQKNCREEYWSVGLLVDLDCKLNWTTCSFFADTGMSTNTLIDFGFAWSWTLQLNLGILRLNSYTVCRSSEASEAILNFKPKDDGNSILKKPNCLFVSGNYMKPDVRVLVSQDVATKNSLNGEYSLVPSGFSQRNLEEHSLTFLMVTEEQKVSGAPQTGPPKEAVGKWSTDHVGKKSPGVEPNFAETIIKSSVEAGHCSVFLVFVWIWYLFDYIINASACIEKDDLWLAGRVFAWGPHGRS